MPDPAGLSGKKVTLATVVGLLLLGTSIAYVLWVYSELDKAREQSETTWRTLATELDERYRQVESRLPDSPGNVNVDGVQAAVEKFRSLTRRRTQQNAALEVEQQLAGAPELLDDVAIASPPQLEQAIQAFNQSQTRERMILDSIGGRVLDTFLSFAEPNEFKLAE